MSGDAETRRAQVFAIWWARDVIENPTCELSPRARLLLLLLAGHCNAAFYCNPGMRLLSIGLGVSDRGRDTNLRTVQRCRAELEAAGLVQVFAGGQGPRATNGFWLAVQGLTPTARADTQAALGYPAKGGTRDAHNGTKGVTHDALRKSTRASPTPPIVIHKGVTGDAKRASPVTPEVTREVSRKRARVSSPLLAADVAKALSDEDEFWGYR